MLNLISRSSKNNWKGVEPKYKNLWLRALTKRRSPIVYKYRSLLFLLM